MDREFLYPTPPLDLDIEPETRREAARESSAEKPTRVTLPEYVFAETSLLPGKTYVVHRDSQKSNPYVAYTNTAGELQRYQLTTVQLNEGQRIIFELPKTLLQINKAQMDEFDLKPGVDYDVRIQPNSEQANRGPYIVSTKGAPIFLQNLLASTRTKTNQFTKGSVIQFLIQPYR